jgi:formin-binding protein 1
LQEEEPKEDYSHLAPNQQKKKLQEKIDSLRTSLAKQTAARYGSNSY